MAVFGYARISTAKQNIDRQIRNIQEYSGDCIVVKEVYTGSRFQNRAELTKLLKKVKPGDTIIFDSVSRMSRNATEGFTLYEELFNKGVNLVFLKESHINTDTYKQAIDNKLKVAIDSKDKATDKFMGKIIDALNEYIMNLAQKQIQQAFDQSEKELSDLQQRTREGIVTAKINGKRIGQPRGATFVTKKSIEAKEKIKKYNYTFGGSLNNEDTIALTGISKMTFYKYKAEIIKELEEENS